ncbi:unnamed protein product [marine sediment metagenome]|uniref:Uncharacterized protein n=1 Tax=marine sediment metagenome TaxID=412755 RepID=X0W6F1_9ZZZZ
MIDKKEITVFGLSFLDLWIQKMFRNVASAKYQFMAAMFIIITYGMFNVNDHTHAPWISATLGLSFLGGGFITFATSRIYMNTKLRENNDLNTDK